jgi:hypothetical protein
MTLTEFRDGVIGLSVFVALVLWWASPSEAELAEQRQQEIVAAQKKAEREAYLRTPEGKTETFMSQASTLCRQDIRARAKYPSKVDFNWIDGNGKRYWMNFDSKGNSRILIRKAGEMMNGFGNMIPFTAACKYDYNPRTNKYSVVEILI